MEDKLADDAPLDYVGFQILPQNRYDACICIDEKDEVIGHGHIDQLMEHLPNIKEQVSKNSSNYLKLELPHNVDAKAWFTKVTLTRFLHIISSPDPLSKSVAINKEILQLEETRKFHMSLYAKVEDGMTSSDSSKNELLQAMVSRVAVLKEELNSTFKLAVGDACSYQDMVDLHQFCLHFGDEDIRNLLFKLLEMSYQTQTVVPMDHSMSPISLTSKNDCENKTGGSIQISGSLNSEKPVIYDASLAKAAEIERQDLTESEDSSSEDDRPSVERSRTRTRYASPRRSASPMRRIQIGRSGPRRTPALTIKSLTCFPPRERISSQRDFGNDGSFESEEPNKKAEVNVTRMSVQDAISLFESKQRDQASETQKKSSVNVKKSSVLRRWSSAMGESQNPQIQNVAENSSGKIVVENAMKSEDVKSDMNPSSEISESHESIKVDIESLSSEKNGSHQSEEGVPVSPTQNVDKMNSVEWNKQKEVELNKMVMKFAEYKNTDLDNGKKGNSSLKQRGGFNGFHKDKREQKLHGEKAGRTPLALRTNQKAQDEPKAEKSGMKVTDAGKKNTSKSQNVNKNSPVNSSTKTESPKPAAPKRAQPKSSTLPVARKPWSSTTSTKASPTKTLTGTLSGTTKSRPKPQPLALNKKPQSSMSISRPSPKLEKPREQKDVGKVQVETKKGLKSANDSKNRVVAKSTKTTKMKPVMTPKEVSNAVVLKKVTKKSSVVPLEAKTSTRRDSATSAASSPTVQETQVSTKSEDSMNESENLVNTQENGATKISDVDHLMEENPEPEIHIGHLETGNELGTEKTKDSSVEDAPCQTLDQGDKITETQHFDEPIISPTAWVDDSIQQDPSVPNGNSTAPSPPTHDMANSTVEPRVHHSLSQMLLKESSNEPDIIEWGNAENPPTMIYQKDASKGFKRLLKFARKNKGEEIGMASTSSYTSEGEDDGDEYKNLARSSVSNITTKKGHPTSKGPKSFFSLSAFRSNKT